MLNLHAGEFLQLIHMLFTMEERLRGLQGELPAGGAPHKFSSDQGVGNFTVGSDEIARICRNLGLPVSALAAENMLPGKTNIAELHGAFKQILTTVMLEMKGQQFYSPTAKYLVYFDNPKLFGDAVFDRFPLANDDIYEAGCCLAFERPTACVMHLMRVLEAGLSALATDLGVPKQNDWGAYLRKIQEELDARTKGLKARSGDEQFYAEAAANFDRLRRAYRNPTMHVDKSYSQERAEEIMQAVKSFMVHLATRLTEAAP